MRCNIVVVVVFNLELVVFITRPTGQSNFERKKGDAGDLTEKPRATDAYPAPERTGDASGGGVAHASYWPSYFPAQKMTCSGMAVNRSGQRKSRRDERRDREA